MWRLDEMVIRRNGPFDDMALDDMVLDEVSCSPTALVPVVSLFESHSWLINLHFRLFT